MSASTVDDAKNSFRATGPVISISSSRGGRHEGCPFVVHSLVCELGLVRNRPSLQHTPGWVEVESGPLGMGQRPLVLVALHELVQVPDLELDGGLLVPAVADPLEEIVEEA
jgi:hypothetical protein